MKPEAIQFKEILAPHKSTGTFTSGASRLERQKSRVTQNVALVSRIQEEDDEEVVLDDEEVLATDLMLTILPLLYMQCITTITFFIVLYVCVHEEYFPNDFANLLAHLVIWVSVAPLCDYIWGFHKTVIRACLSTCVVLLLFATLLALKPKYNAMAVCVLLSTALSGCLYILARAYGCTQLVGLSKMKSLRTLYLCTALSGDVGFILARFLLIPKILTYPCFEQTSCFPLAIGITGFLYLPVIFYILHFKEKYQFPGITKGVFSYQMLVLDYLVQRALGAISLRRKEKRFAKRVVVDAERFKELLKINGLMLLIYSVTLRVEAEFKPLAMLTNTAIGIGSLELTPYWVRNTITLLYFVSGLLLYFVIHPALRQAHREGVIGYLMAGALIGVIATVSAFLVALLAEMTDPDMSLPPGIGALYIFNPTDVPMAFRCPALRDEVIVISPVNYKVFSDINVLGNITVEYSLFTPRSEITNVTGTFVLIERSNMVYYSNGTSLHSYRLADKRSPENEERRCVVRFIGYAADPALISPLNVMNGNDLYMSVNLADRDLKFLEPSEYSIEAKPVRLYRGGFYDVLYCRLNDTYTEVNLVTIHNTVNQVPVLCYLIPLLMYSMSYVLLVVGYFQICSTDITMQLRTLSLTLAITTLLLNYDTAFIFNQLFFFESIVYRLLTCWILLLILVLLLGFQLANYTFVNITA